MKFKPNWKNCNENSYKKIGIGIRYVDPDLSQQDDDCCLVAGFKQEEDDFFFFFF